MEVRVGVVSRYMKYDFFFVKLYSAHAPPRQKIFFLKKVSSLYGIMR